MLEKLMKLYIMAMALDVRSPMPHLFGPPGCGKSTVAEQLAALLKVNLHIINVSRLSPLDVEGVQMPMNMEDPALAKLHMLPATFWTSLQEGDIILLDEFLRGFPEVYNALLDILTSRRVGAFVLPKVFIMGASNSIVSYDRALEDRLLHLPVKDPRNNKTEQKNLAKMLVEALGLLPDMATSMEMQSVLDTEVLPMYDCLDQIKGKASNNGASTKGRSLRNLIGQAQLREVKSSALKELIDMNNRTACNQAKHQYVMLLDGKPATIAGLPGNYVSHARKLKDNAVINGKLTEVQRINLDLNLQLIEMESIRNENKGVSEDDVFDIDDLS